MQQQSCRAEPKGPIRSIVLQLQGKSPRTKSGDVSVITVFFLIFLAAMAGLIKPYIKRSKRWHFGVAAFVAFFLFMGQTGKELRGDFAADASTKKTVPVASSTMSDSDTPSQPASSWEYSDHKDEMRGTSSRLAQVDSANIVNLDFPYGEVHGQLWIRERSEDGLNAAFEVEKGQVLCNDLEDSHVSVKFDDGPVQKFGCSGTADGSSNVAFINNAHRFLAELKKSKRAIVEAEFFEQGRKQFTFDTAGLNWKSN